MLNSASQFWRVLTCQKVKFKKDVSGKKLGAEPTRLFSASKALPQSSAEGLAGGARPNTHRHNGKDSFGWRVAEENVDEGDHLQSFPQTHAVGQDTAKATTGLKSLQGLNQVIIEESDPTNLTGNKHRQIYLAGKDQGSSLLSLELVKIK